MRAQQELDVAWTGEGEAAHEQYDKHLCGVASCLVLHHSTDCCQCKGFRGDRGVGQSPLMVPL